MILLASIFLRFFAGKNVRAMALFPFILVRDMEVKKNKITIHHEKIHWIQQIEMLLVLFYLFYMGFYLYYRLCGMNHFNAYLSIPFEKEAYSNQDNMNYLVERPFLAWIKYL